MKECRKEGLVRSKQKDDDFEVKEAGNQEEEV